MSDAGLESRSWLNHLAFGLLLILVFTVPFDDILAVPGFGTLSRLVGYAAIGTALGDVISRSSFRRPRGALVWVILFSIWAGLSMTWTLSFGASTEKVLVVVRSLGMAWLLYEYLDGDARWRAVLTAFVLGGYVCVGGLLTALRTGPLSEELEYARYAVGDLDPNDVAATLALGVPMAWYLAGKTRSRVIRLLSRIYLPLAGAAILLTGSRGGLMALVVALGFVLSTLPRLSVGAKCMAVMALVAGAAAIHFLVPDTAWTRLLTIPDELREGTFANRTLIWRAGFKMLPDHPFGGAGVGAFKDEIFMKGGYFTPKVAHNLILGVLFDLGIVGLALFIGVLSSLVRRLRYLHVRERRVAQFILLTWLVAGMGLSLEYRKVTWFLIGSLTALTVRVSRSAWIFDEPDERTLAGMGQDVLEPGMDGMEG